MNNVISSIGGNITYAKETNFSLLNTDTDIWEGELPYKPGSEFPTNSIKERANKLKTARLLFYNDSESIFESLINIFPEIDPTTGWQIRELVANIPQFKNCINSWVGVLVGKMPIIDCRNDQYDLLVSKVLDSSNLTQFVLTEATNLFLEDTSVYKISESLSGKPHISYVDSKNVVLFVNKNNIDEVEVVVVFNINNTENKEIYLYKKYSDDFEYNLDCNWFGNNETNYKNLNKYDIVGIDGDELKLAIDMEKCHFFDPETEQRIRR